MFLCIVKKYRFIFLGIVKNIFRSAEKNSKDAKKTSKKK
jgi:hypothetical protein